MKVIVDFELCESNAVCVEECPRVFRVNQRDQLELLDETPPATLRPQLEAAVVRCPRRAIALEG